MCKKQIISIVIGSFLLSVGNFLVFLLPYSQNVSYLALPFLLFISDLIVSFVIAYGKLPFKYKILKGVMVIVLYAIQCLIAIYLKCYSWGLHLFFEDNVTSFKDNVSGLGLLAFNFNIILYIAVILVVFGLIELFKGRRKTGDGSVSCD